MKTNGAFYWWIANYREKGERPRLHADFLREWLPLAAAKLGAPAGLILCNPADREAIAALEGYDIGELATIPVNNFWIGAKPNGAGEGSSEPGEGK